MNVQTFSRKVLTPNWNVSAGPLDNWERAQEVPIVFKKHLTEIDSPKGNATQTGLNRETETDAARYMSNTALRILMVEDSEDDCDLIRLHLGKCGYKPRIERVYSEDAMRAALEREQWDVVFTDHGLPGFSGTAAVALIRKMNLTIPILCITGTLDPLIIRQILATGVFACISKDDLSMLCQTIQRALSGNSGWRI